MQEEISKLQERLESIKANLDLGKKRKLLRELEAKSAKSDFWQDEEKAKKIMQEIADLRGTLQEIEDLESAIQENIKLIDLADQEKAADPGLKKDIKSAIAKAESRLNSLELETFLSDRYDQEDAILSIHAGQGGTEAMDWAAMLFRMYTRFIENKKWKWELLDETAGEEAGIKSATLLVKGKYAYGYLKGEAGVHRLVRQSPFNADKLRQTSFALVEILPNIKQPKEVELNEEDIKFQAFRASGHGGQNVNKVSTAVRLKHIPSGITVECQAQRYQEQNRKLAMQLLASRLWERKQKDHQKKVKSLKGEHKVAGWGNQIRSYVLHPYHMVKDLRTDIETQDTEAVLDGQLQKFIGAQVRQL